MIIAEKPTRIEVVLQKIAARRLYFFSALAALYFVAGVSFTVMWAFTTRHAGIRWYKFQVYDWSALTLGFAVPQITETFLVAILSAAVVAISIRDDPLGLSMLLTPILMAAMFTLGPASRTLAVLLIVIATLFVVRKLERQGLLAGYFSAVLNQIFKSFRFILWCVVSLWLMHNFRSLI